MLPKTAVNNFKEFVKYLLGSKLILLGISIYLLFSISALLPNHFMDYFFFGSSVHYCCKGLDFYGIPNGVYSFLHGGDLSGSRLPVGIGQYSENHLSNPNDYHPLFSLIIGFFLIQFNPDTSFNSLILVKIFITFFAVFYIYKNFKDNKYLNLAIFLFLSNFSTYNETRISQYQFFFNIFFLLFLINISKNKDKYEGGLIYFLTLISKPISLLWVPVLLIKKKITEAVVGLFLFIVSTLTFVKLGIDKHYLQNLIYHLSNSSSAWSIDYMSLDAFLRHNFGINPTTVKTLKWSSLILIYLLSFLKKTNVLTSLFLLTVYFLFFYDNLFQYHFSVLTPIITVCLLNVKEFQTKIAKILIIIINLPTVFFILRFSHFQFYFDPIYGPNPTYLGWSMVSFFQLLPIFLLAFYVLIITLRQSNLKHEIHKS